MPTYQLHCPQCDHRFSGMVFTGAQLPEQWVCPKCGSEQAKLDERYPPQAHPLEASQGGCPCCGGASHSSPVE